MTARIEALPLTPSEARQFSDAIADVLCWFYGFRAAKADDTWVQPPGLSELERLQMRLRDLPWDQGSPDGRRGPPL